MAAAPGKLKLAVDRLRFVIGGGTLSKLKSLLDSVTFRRLEAGT